LFPNAASEYHGFCGAGAGSAPSDRAVQGAPTHGSGTRAVRDLDLHEEPSLSALDPEITDGDRAAFRRITSVELSPEQEAQVACPPRAYRDQEAVLAVHWHPEVVPIPLIAARIDATFPGRRDELIIPTQHNEVLGYNGFAGVEIDCYSSLFKRKVQLLLHAREDRLTKAEVLRSMCRHTYRYRATQLFQYLDAVLDPGPSQFLQAAAAETGAGEPLLEFVRVQVGKLRDLIAENEHRMDPGSLKNRLLQDFLDQHRSAYGDLLINRSLSCMKAVKRHVKRGFDPSYFYTVMEVIEEARAAGCGIVIPHPEQFWPILLAEYDVDGYEVWNPQSREYTEFLIDVVTRQNQSVRQGRRPLLIFMGDDTHMMEKIKPPEMQDPAKVHREVGVQDGWEDPGIRKRLIVANVDRLRVIQEYRCRLE
jgi:hypothetical protein